MQFGTCAAVLLALVTIVCTEDIVLEGVDLETVDDANPYADSRKLKMREKIIYRRTRRNTSCWRMFKEQRWSGSAACQRIECEFNYLRYTFGRTWPPHVQAAFHSQTIPFSICSPL